MSSSQKPGPSASPLAELIVCQSVSFFAMTTWTLPTAEGKESPLLRGMKLAVKAQRPGSLRIEDVTTNEDMPPPYLPGERILNPWDVFVSDGKCQYELASASKCYEAAKAAHKLQQTRHRHGLPRFVAPDILFAKDPLESFTLQGEAFLNDLPVAVYRN